MVQDCQAVDPAAVKMNKPVLRSQDTLSSANPSPIAGVLAPLYGKAILGF